MFPTITVFGAFLCAQLGHRHAYFAWITTWLDHPCLASRDIRHYRASAIPPLSEATLTMRLCSEGPVHQQVEHIIIVNLSFSITIPVRTSMTRAQNPDRLDDLDQEVTLFGLGTTSAHHSKLGRFRT